MFIKPLLQVPDIQPYVTQYMVIGPAMGEADVYQLSLTGIGMFVSNELGRSGHIDRFEAMTAFIQSMVSAMAGSLQEHDPFMVWFTPGVQFRGTDAHYFAILNAVARVFCDYHTIRSRGYARLSKTLEENFIQLTESSYGEDRSLREDWANQLARVEDLAEMERAFVKPLKELAHCTRLYGKKTENSMLAVFERLWTNDTLLFTRYVG